MSSALNLRNSSVATLSGGNGVNERVEKCLRENKLTRDSNRFFNAARKLVEIDGDGAYQIAIGWREITKTFMFTTISGLGVMAHEASLISYPPDSLLQVLQTGFGVIGDDLRNNMEVFQKSAPDGTRGIHYVWWENSIILRLARCLHRDIGESLNKLPIGSDRLIENMKHLAKHRMGAAVQLRVVEAIALDITVAFKRIYTRTKVNDTRVFDQREQMGWMDAHIEAEVLHHQAVADHDLGMTGIVRNSQDEEDMMLLMHDYCVNWNHALNGFAACMPVVNE